MKNKRGYYISKRKTFDSGDSLRRLVLVKGENATTTPINIMIKDLKLKNYELVHTGGKEVMFEKYVMKKKKNLSKKFNAWRTP